MGISDTDISLELTPKAQLHYNKKENLLFMFIEQIIYGIKTSSQQHSQNLIDKIATLILESKDSKMDLKEEDKKWITDAYYNEGKYINEGKIHHLDVDMDFDDEIWDKNDNSLD